MSKVSRIDEKLGNLEESPIEEYYNTNFSIGEVEFQILRDDFSPTREALSTQL